jgi:hypothetical protein
LADANLGKQARITKASLLALIQELDHLTDGQGLDEDGWALRYYLEEEVIQILSNGQRGCRNSIKKEDTKIKYFHSFANGRRCKCAILSLSTEAGPITDKLAIQDHMYVFYLALMESDEPKPLKLDSQIWEGNAKLLRKRTVICSTSFSTQELDKVLHETKTETAPGSDGVPMAFFKKF